MDKPKAKRGDNRSSKFSFVALWTISCIPLWIGFWMLVDRREYRIYEYSAYGTTKILILAIALIMVAIPYLQYQAVERLLKRHMPGWFLACVLGAVLSFFAFVGTQPLINIRLNISALSLFIPPALAQMIWLWRRVRSAWLWPLGSIAAALLFVVSFRDYRVWEDSWRLPFVVLPLGIIQGVIQGIIMQYLWTQRKDTDKQKKEGAAKETFDQEPVQRLEEHDTNETFERDGEGQIAQYEAR
jgi:hypothetical protein